MRTGPSRSFEEDHVLHRVPQPIARVLSSSPWLSFVRELIAHQEGNLNVPELPGTARFSAQEETDRQQPDRQVLLLLN